MNMRERYQAQYQAKQEAEALARKATKAIRRRRIKETWQERSARLVYDGIDRSPDSDPYDTERPSW